MKIRLFLANLLFLNHVILVMTWVGLFLVPVSFWPGRITFHFYMTVAIIISQFIWGLIILPWTGKFRMVCALTTLTQLLRNQKISDSKNYDHSFFQEFLGKRNIKIPHAMSTLITFSILALVTFQYFFLR